MAILKRLIPFNNLKETILRFPLSVLCALALFVIGILLIREIVDEHDEIIFRLMAIFGCCYFWFGISKLMAESQNWGKVKYIVVSFVVSGAIAAIFLLSSFWWINLIFVLPALLLTLMVAPYLKGGDDIDVWFFNRMTWLGVVISYIAILLFAGGLSIALSAIYLLFSVDISEIYYFYIWLFAALVLGPIYALSWIPKTFQFSDDDCSDLAGLKFIVNWISVPIVFVYLFILYAYFIKIIVMGEMPNGHLAYMITGFAGAGIITYLVAHPLRYKGSLQLKLFYKIFFPALIIPVAFHFYAIWERISAYGVTEQRYLILISAVWFLFVSLVFSFKKAPIKTIPASLAILMILASFGSWGGVAVSGQSQFSRLEALLIKNNLLVDGKIIKTEVEIPFADRKGISSILDYLCSSDREQMISKWFNTDNKEDWNCYARDITSSQLAFIYTNKYSLNKRDVFNFRSTLKPYMLIDKYDVIIKNAAFYSYDFYNNKVWEREWNLESTQKVKMSYSNTSILISIDQYDEIEVDLLDIFSKETSAVNGERVMVEESENKDIVYRLVFSSLGGKVKGGDVTINHASFDFLYRIKNKPQ